MDSSYIVLDIPINSNEQPLAQTTYQLDSAKNGSAVSNFLNTYQNPVIKFLVKLNTDNEITGLWVGMDSKPQLFSFAVYPDQQSNFTLHLNGEDFVMSTTFLWQILVKTGVLFILKLSPYFRQSAIDKGLGNAQLRNYMYSERKGQTLQSGEFWLLRIEALLKA